jgi:hypothetical protein
MNPASLTLAATASYSANCALGGGVALGLLDTRNARWVHHALYVLTVGLTASAVGASLWGRSRSGLALAPALVPLALIPALGTHNRRHMRVALAAAPFYAAALLLARR